MIYRWFQVERWLREKGINPKLGIEVGSKHGRFSSHMLKVFPDLIITMVDPMEVQPDGNETYKEWNWDKIYKEFHANMEKYRGRYIHLKDYSVNVAPLIPEQCFDFVFIDAQHDYKSVKQDIALWEPKVKPGGLLMGHDYCGKFPEIMRAVDESFKVETGDNDTWLRI